MNGLSPTGLISPGTVPLQWCNPLEQPSWDQLVASHPDATVFHSQGWARVLAATYKFKPWCLLAADEHRLWGLLPVFEVNSLLTGKRGVSLPFTDECKPLSSPALSETRLVGAAAEFGRTAGWKYLECRNARMDLDGSTPSVSFYEHSLELERGADMLLEGFDSSVRRAIRKAANSGVTVAVESSASAMEAYYRLHCLTRQKHGLPPQSWNFFQNIQSSLVKNNQGFVILARIGEKVAAGMVVLLFGKKAVYKFGASDPAYDSLRPNNFVMWTAIRELCARGFESLSLGRTSLANAGLRRYKLQWGAREQTIHYYKLDLRESKFLTDTDQSSGLHTAFFRKCPRGIARLLGRLLYPHIA